MISRSKKRMAADVLNVGITRVKLDPNRSDSINDATTKAGIRGLIREGAIWVEPKKGVSRGRWRNKRKRIIKRSRGQGSRKGASGARTNKKTLWMTKVRALRKHLKARRDHGDITGSNFKEFYKKIKGGQVRSVRHLRDLLSRISG